MWTQMANKRPSPQEIRQALIDHGVDAKFYNTWDTTGRSWGWEGGNLDAVVLHHTATASALPGNGAPSLYWATNAFKPMMVANQLVGKDPGTNWILSARGTYHSGLGGPWRAVGLNSAGNTLHWRAWGIEIDDPGRSNTLSPYQIEQTARTVAALWDLCGWPEDGSRIVTHGDWTDSGPFLGEASFGPYRNRKNDTLRQWYDQKFWRAEASKYRHSANTDTWDGTIPKRSAVNRAIQNDEANKATYRVACRLHDLKFRGPAPKPLGKQKYPRQAVVNFQKSVGLPANGEFTSATQRKLFGKGKP